MGYVRRAQQSGLRRGHDPNRGKRDRFGKHKLHRADEGKTESLPEYYQAGGISKQGIRRLPSGPPPSHLVRCTETYDTRYGPRQCEARVVKGLLAQHVQTQHRPPLRR